MLKQDKYESVWNFADWVTSINNKLIIVTGYESSDHFTKSEADKKGIKFFFKKVERKNSGIYKESKPEIHGSPRDKTPKQPGKIFYTTLFVILQ